MPVAACCLAAVVCAPPQARAQALDDGAADTLATVLSEHELEQFRAQALINVDRLSEYISVIADKQRPKTDKETAIDYALLLFTGEDAIVEVSSVSRPRPRKLKVREYLHRLMNLPYSRVEIDWAEIAYASEFEKGTDGRYYATATITQRFTGYGEDGRPAYEDTTVKQITIVLQPVVIQTLLEEKKEWDVLLADISVTQTL